MVFFKFIKYAHTGVKTQFGKITSSCKPGLNFYIPIIQSIQIVSNKTRNMTTSLNVKTKDDVFTMITIGVQVTIDPEHSIDALTKLDDPYGQIETYVKNIVRSTVPTLTLDEVFASQGEVSTKVLDGIFDKMKEYGFTINDVLIDDIKPDKEVTYAMNAINASLRMKEAAKNEADAEYIRKVKEAEADRDRKILQGEGISGQRKAILEGYKENVNDMSDSLGLTPKEVVDFVLKTQELDTRHTIGTSVNTKVLFVPSDLDSGCKSLITANETREE